MGVSIDDRLPFDQCLSPEACRPPMARATRTIPAKPRLLSRKAVARKAGVRTHRARCGPERDLVNGFLNELQVVVPSDCQCTVFREPWLECGIPDLVIVVWHVPTVDSWVDARAHIEGQDLRVLQFLIHAKASKQDQLFAVYGPKVLANLGRLCDANLVHQRGRVFKPAALSRTFGLRAIISVEAKISDWRNAFEQAQRNLWFACASYILMPERRTGRAGADAGKIRFCTPETVILRAPLRSEPPAPRCYAAWLFNEWVWRTRKALPEAHGGSGRG